MRTLLIIAITSLAFISTAIAGPIHDAARDGDVAKVMQLLLANHAKVNARAEWGWTPLHLAPSAEIVGVLLAAGANVDARDKNGKTGLHMEAERGRGNIAKVLLAAGADGSLKDGEGKTPFDWASGLKNEDPDTYWLLNDAQYK